jgi:hypothetical protein
MSLRFCPRPEHSGRVIPPGESCLDCQEEARDQQEREQAEDLPCEHRRIIYACSDCGELEPRSPGYLYPVLTDGDGRILDGRARLAADPTWPMRELPTVVDDIEALQVVVKANMFGEPVGDPA